MEEIKETNHDESPNQQYDEVASVLNPNDIKFAGDINDDIRFPDIEYNPDDEEFYDKYQIVLEWLANNTNEDGSWKYGGIAIPKEWQEDISQQLEAKKDIYEERVERRNKTIEWMKYQKNVDFSLEDGWEIEKFYSKLSDEDKESIRGDKDRIVSSLDPFVEKTNSKKRIDSLHCLARGPFRVFISKYGDGIISDLTADIITKRIRIIASEASSRYLDDGEMRVDYDEYTEDDHEFSKVIDEGTEELSTAIEVADFSKDDQIINTYMDTVVKYPMLKKYARVHPIDSRRVKAYIENVAPMVDKKDPEVQRLWDNPGWGFATVFYEGDRFGASDFCIHALTSKINPTNIQELLLARRDVSSESDAAYEQNRNDAYELEGTIIDYRGFIHREAPGEHEILSAMLKFYDTKDDPEEHTKAEVKLHEIYKIYGPGGHNYALSDRMFDLSNYELDEQQRRTGRKEKVVDALRRLVENTDPKLLEKPAVKDEQLNDLIQNMYLGINKQSGEAYVDFKEVGKVVRRMNELLKECQGKTGIKPSEVKTIAFMERIATFAMRGISEKNRQELPFDPDFKEICRFAELTSQSDKYDEPDFENFWKKFSWIRDFDNKDEITEHFQMLSSRRLAQLRGLPEKTPFLKQRAEALWSGNLNNELLGLVDKR